MKVNAAYMIYAVAHVTDVLTHDRTTGAARAAAE
jgi:hypothetical protein